MIKVARVVLKSNKIEEKPTKILELIYSDVYIVNFNSVSGSKSFVTSTVDCSRFIIVMAGSTSWRF